MDNENPQNILKPSDETIRQLATGFTEINLPNLQKTKQQLGELTEKQECLIAQIHDENMKIASTMHIPEYHCVFNMVKLYQTKVCSLRRDLKCLYDKSNKLKGLQRRAEKLQTVVEREASLRNQIREMQLKQEEQLIGRTSRYS